MVVSIEHKKKISKELSEYAIQKLIEVGSKIFTEDWMIVKGMTSVPDHWHLIAEDTVSTDPNEQKLLKTVSVIWRSTNI